MVRVIFLGEWLPALKTDLGCWRQIGGAAHLLGQPTGAAVCAAVSEPCFEILWVFWKFLLRLTEDSWRHLRSISVLLLLLHVRFAATLNGSGLFLKKGGSELLFSWFLAEVDLGLFSRGNPSRSIAWLRTWLPIAAVSAGQKQGPHCEQQTHALAWWCATEHRSQQCWFSGSCDISSLSLSVAPQGGLRNAGAPAGLRTWAFVPGRVHAAN